MKKNTTRITYMSQETTKVKPKKKRKRRRKKGSNHYFRQEHEDAIIQYTNTDCPIERQQLCKEFIVPALSEMVDKIVFTYKFTLLPNCDELREECKVWLITVLDKFKPEKGSKAFSYFSVITKNWFIHKVKKNAYRNKKEVHFDTMPKEIEEKHLSIDNPYNKAREQKEFWDHFWKEVEEWGKLPMKDNEKKVYEAMRILMKDPDDIEIFNKKAIYLYIRELTGLNTKQVVNNLNRIRAKYRNFKANWDEGNI